MIKKVVLVAGIIACTIFVILFVTVMMPVIRSFTQIAADDPVLSGEAAGNFTYYEAAVNAAPMWIYGIPVFVSGVALFMALYQKRKNT